MRTTIELPEALFHAIEEQADKQGVSPKILIARLVKAGLHSDQPQSSRPRRKPSRLPIIRKANTGKQLPCLSSEQIHQLDLDEDVAKHGRSARR